MQSPNLAWPSRLRHTAFPAEAIIDSSRMPGAGHGRVLLGWLLGTRIFVPGCVRFALLYEHPRSASEDYTLIPYGCVFAVVPRQLASSPDFSRSILGAKDCTFSSAF
jgi:hypothetical protein